MENVKPCVHDRQEYMEMSWGEESWKCLNCGQISLRYIDCGQGG